MVHVHLFFNSLLTVGHHVHTHRRVRHSRYGCHAGGAAGNDSLSLHPLPGRHLLKLIRTSQREEKGGKRHEARECSHLSCFSC